ncbi:MAG: hypothetical protein CMQ15_11375 [Gammaproteobacteria bacterium]|nr:hypothetical protein [Gammaproteobacteria bacterium]
MKAWISIEIAFIVPILGWFMWLRRSDPLEPWFERIWQPGEFGSRENLSPFNRWPLETTVLPQWFA